MNRATTVVLLSLTLLLIVGFVAGCGSGSGSGGEASGLFGAAAFGIDEDGFGLTADPTDVVIDTSTEPPADAADAVLTATVYDPLGEIPLEGVEVEFSSNGGTLASGGTLVLTNTEGVATDTLTVALADPDTIEVTAVESSVGRTQSVTVNKVVILPNQDPVADAGMDVQAACDSEEGAAVTLDGSASSDPDSTPDTNDIVSFVWYENYETPESELLGEGETLDVLLSWGTHTITLVVTDSEGATSTDEIVVEIFDDEAPYVEMAFDPEMLWPPNHKMVDIQALISVSDCSPVTVTLVSVTSNEPENGTGDGDTAPDIMGLEGGEDYEFQLRAERAGGGSGRVYTVVYQVTDSAGLMTETVGEIVVPHDQGGN